MINISRSVEVRHTFSAKLAREKVLMVVDYDSDTSIAKLIDQLVNLVEVVEIVDSGFTFD